MNALAIALAWAASMAANERNPAEVDRFASDLIELSTGENFVFWLAWGSVSRGWARSALGNAAQAISWINDGIRDYAATGSMIGIPCWWGLKAEALHLANRPSEALVVESRRQSGSQKERVLPNSMRSVECFFASVGDR